MNIMTREQLSDLFRREFKINPLNDIENQVLELILDDFCDITKDIYNVSEQKLYILRKIYGIYDNGVCQTRVSVAKELGLSSSRVSELAKSAIRCLHGCLNKYLCNSEKIEQFRNLNLSIEDLQSVEIPITLKNYFETKNIHNYGDLIKVSDEELYKMLIDKSYLFSPIFNYKILKGKEDYNIEVLDFSIRTYNCLKRRNISNISQILSMEEDELLCVRNLGRKGFEEIIEKMHSLDLLMSWEMPIDKKQDDLLQEHNASVVEVENVESPIEKYKRLLNEKTMLQQKLFELDTELAELLVIVRDNEIERFDNDGTSRK